jgi:hypothetical protein
MGQVPVGGGEGLSEEISTKPDRRLGTALQRLITQRRLGHAGHEIDNRRGTAVRSLTGGPVRSAGIGHRRSLLGLLGPAGAVGSVGVATVGAAGALVGQPVIAVGFGSVGEEPAGLPAHPARPSAFGWHASSGSWPLRLSGGGKARRWQWVGSAGEWLGAKLSLGAAASTTVWALMGVSAAAGRPGLVAVDGELGESSSMLALFLLGQFAPIGPVSYDPD